MRKWWKLLGMMHKAGIPIIAGTDGAGIEIIHELEIYIQAGFTPAEALAAATIAAGPAGGHGRAHRLDQRSGRPPTWRSSRAILPRVSGICARPVCRTGRQACSMPMPCGRAAGYSEPPEVAASARRRRRQGALTMAIDALLLLLHLRAGRGARAREPVRGRRPAAADHGAAL